jgi:DsbC/DsbD-like thiol-disulfide interchange protein
VKKPAPRSGRPPALQAFARPTAAEALKHEQVSGKLYLSVDRLAPGSVCRVAMVAKVKEGWHLNANPAKPDYVVPVELELKSAAGVELTDVVYPAGRDITLDGFDEAVSVYEGNVVLYGTLKVPENVTASKDELEFTMRYQACNDKECLRQMKLKLSGTATFAGAPRDAKPVNESLFEAEPKKQDRQG